VDVTELGIPTVEEFVADYSRKMDIPPIHNWDFYVAFTFFRFAAILQGVYKRAISGIYSVIIFLEIYFFLFILALQGVNLSELGIPTVEEVVGEYCSRMRLPPIHNWDFYVVFTLFRRASINQGVYKRSLSGITPPKQYTPKPHI
jgi:aminoglycoside phosphotransferase (APT) family kinase protein